MKIQRSKLIKMTSILINTDIYEFKLFADCNTSELIVKPYTFKKEDFIELEFNDVIADFMEGNDVGSRIKSKKEAKEAAEILIDNEFDFEEENGELVCEIY